jgi:hypothetical protein
MSLKIMDFKVKNYKIVVGIFLAQIALSQSAIAADEIEINSKIPTLERDFVNAINGFNKAKIVAQFGDPAKADEVKIKGTGKVVASIWQYHFINTASDGSYYPTTELDFIDDKVVTVVFLNNDGSEASEDGKKYEVPTGQPEL